MGFVLVPPTLLGAFADRLPVPVHSRKETEVVREPMVLHIHTHRATQNTDNNSLEDCNHSIYLFISLSPAYSPSPEAGESKPPPSKDPSRWSVEEVVWFIKDADPQALGPHVELFRKHVSVVCNFITA